jgi:EpsI family protein
MRSAERWLLAISFAAVLALPLLWFELRPALGAGNPQPDLQAILAHEPAGWRARQKLEEVVDPRWSPATQAAYDTVVMRQFVRADGAEVTLLVTWSRDGRLRAGHDQEICYRAGGFAVSRMRTETLPAGAAGLGVTSFTGERGNFAEDVVYWRVTGGRLDPVESDKGELKGKDILVQRLHRLRHMLSGDVPDNVMVRVSTRRPAHMPPAQVNETFVKGLLQALGPSERQTILGR